MLLLVVNPADNGHYRVHKRLVVHAVLSVKVDSLRIYFTKHIVSIYRGILVAKESVDVGQLVVSNATEALLRLVFIFLDQCLVHIELLNAIQSRILELLRTRHAMRLHRLAHLQCGIHTDAVIAIELLSIHAAH